MASTSRSLCLYCKSSAEHNAELEFHDIYDELSMEFNLPILVQKYFKIDVRNVPRDSQLLCQECFNHLIDQYDLDEYDNEMQQLDATTADEGQEEEQQDQEQCFQVAEIVEQHSSNVPKQEPPESFVATAVIECEANTKSENSYSPLLVVEQDDSTAGKSSHEDESNATDHQLTDEILETLILQSEESEMPNRIEMESNETSDYEEILPDHEQEQEYFHLEEVAGAGVVIIEEIADAEVAEVYAEYSNDTSEDCNSMLLEEEYLIEETICSQEFDEVDYNEYLARSILTKFEDLNFDWKVQCNLCAYEFENFQDLLTHSCIFEVMDDDQHYSCIINGCKDVLTEYKQLARHLIFSHYEDIDSLKIYGRCPDCQKSFSNIMDFNRHSCCGIKRKLGTRSFCQACNMNFQSLKRYVFHMQFHLTSHRPKMCLLCGDLFKDVNDFFEHVTYNHRKKDSFACIQCDRCFRDKEVFEKHIQAHESKTAYKCTECPQSYTTRTGLMSHMEIYHNHETKYLQCEYCGKQYASLTGYRAHMKAHRPEVSVNVFACSACGLIASSEEAIQSHIDLEEPSSANKEILRETVSIAYTCENCSCDYLTAHQLAEHRKSPQHNGKLFHCPMCRKCFRTLKHMRNHITSHKDYDQWQNDFPIARFYMCDIGTCQDSYPLWTSLYYHKKRHKQQDAAQDLICQFCERQCPTKMSLAIHVARVHNNNHVQCPECKKMYKTQKDLKDHMTHMHIEIQCSQCHIKFKNRRNLLSHEQLVHKNEKRFFCSHCNKGYYYKSECEAHERNVHSEVSYKCDLCGFTTNYAKSLDIHMAKHTNQQPFKCSYCSKTFGRKQLLNVHEKRHKPNRDFTCSDHFEGGCRSSFITHYLLKKHIQRMHLKSKGNKNKKLSKVAKISTSRPYHQYDDSRNSIDLISDDTETLDADEVEPDDSDDIDDEAAYEIHYEYKECDDDDDGDGNEEIMEEAIDEDME